jgi:membrane associated rhomboid family serine protease
MKQFPPVILALISINGIIYLPALVAPDLYKTVLNYCALYFPKSESFHIFQLISHMFLHDNRSLLHIFCNMFALASFGIPLTMVWGWKRFLIFYFTVGIGAGLVYLGVNYYHFNNAYQAFIAAGFTPESMLTLLQTSKADPTLIAKLPEETVIALLTNYTSSAIGASGAVYGILVAFGVLFPNAKLSLIFLPIPIPAKFFIPGIVLLDLFSGITGVSLFGGGIAHFAHVGGAAIGFIIMLYWKMRYPVKIQFRTS